MKSYRMINAKSIVLLTEHSLKYDNLYNTLYYMYNTADNTSNKMPRNVRSGQYLGICPGQSCMSISAPA